MIKKEKNIVGKLIRGPRSNAMIGKRGVLDADINAWITLGILSWNRAKQKICYIKNGKKTYPTISPKFGTLRIESTSYSLWRVVWLCTRGPIQNPRHSVTHRIGTDRKSCDIDDLEIVSWEELHRRASVRGIKNYRAKLNRGQVKKARRLRDEGYKLREIKQILGLDTSLASICQLCRGHRYSDIK